MGVVVVEENTSRSVVVVGVVGIVVVVVVVVFALVVLVLVVVVFVVVENQLLPQVLVGEALMRSSDPARLIATFRGLDTDSLLVKACGFKVPGPARPPAPPPRPALSWSRYPDTSPLPVT